MRMWSGLLGGRRTTGCQEALRSSAITFPSLGSDPGAASSTWPPSLVTVRKLAATSLRNASLAAATSMSSHRSRRRVSQQGAVGASLVSVMVRLAAEGAPNSSVTHTKIVTN